MTGPKNVCIGGCSLWASLLSGVVTFEGSLLSGSKKRYRKLVQLSSFLRNKRQKFVKNSSLIKPLTPVQLVTARTTGPCPTPDVITILSVQQEKILPMTDQIGSIELGICTKMLGTWSEKLGAKCPPATLGDSVVRISRLSDAFWEILQLKQAQ